MIDSRTIFAATTLRSLAASTLLILSTSGCGLLVGNVRPVDEKADDYSVMDLSKDDRDWVKLNPGESAPDEAIEGETASDLAYQSRKTASIISLNSSCRRTREQEERDLREATQMLLLGFSDVSDRTEEQLTIDGTPALQTTLSGKLNDSPMALRTVVLKRGYCVFDMMYVAKPRVFGLQEPVFKKFVGSLKIR